MTLKLEVGKTYLTSSGVQVTIRDMQTVPIPNANPLRMFREYAGSPVVWTEGGGNISGQQNLGFVMELHPPAAPVVAPTVVATGAGPQVVIDWDARTVRVVP